MNQFVLLVGFLFFLFGILSTAEAECDSKGSNVDLTFILEQCSKTNDYFLRASLIKHHLDNTLLNILDSFPGSRFAIASTSSDKCYSLQTALTGLTKLRTWSAVKRAHLPCSGLAVQSAIVALHDANVHWKNNDTKTRKVLLAIVGGPPARINPNKELLTNQCDQSPPSPERGGNLMRQKNAGLIILVLDDGGRAYKAWVDYAQSMGIPTIVRQIGYSIPELTRTIQKTVSEYLCIEPLAEEVKTKSLEKDEGNMKPEEGSGEKISRDNNNNKDGSHDHQDRRNYTPDNSKDDDKTNDDENNEDENNDNENNDHGNNNNENQNETLPTSKTETVDDEEKGHSTAIIGVLSAAGGVTTLAAVSVIVWKRRKDQNGQGNDFVPGVELYDARSGFW